MVVYSEDTLQEYKIKLKNQNNINDELRKFKKALRKEDTSQLKKGNEEEFVGSKLNNEIAKHFYNPSDIYWILTILFTNIDYLVNNTPKEK